MKILILKSTVADGRPVQAGQVEDVSDSDARILLRMGKATLAVEVTEVEAPVVLDTVEAAPVVEQTRRGRRGNK